MDRVTLRRLVEMTADAYERAPEYEELGYVVEPIFVNPTEVFIIYNDEQLIIAFRGTDSFEDAKLDIDFRKTRLKGLPGKYHRGIVRALNKVYLRALSKLQFKGANRKVYIVGHSLGGALAVLFAARLAGWSRASYIDGVITTGAPRVMDATAAQAYNRILGTRTTQFENLGDEITHVPMRLFGFRHVGDRVVLHGDVTPSVEKRLTNPIVARIARYLPKVTKKLLHTKEAHSSKLYVRRVNRWANGSSGQPNQSKT